MARAHFYIFLTTRKPALSLGLTLFLLGSEDGGGGLVVFNPPV